MVGTILLCLAKYFVYCKLKLDPGWIVRYERNFTCTSTVLIYAYISTPHERCHINSQLGWDHVSTQIDIVYIAVIALLQVCVPPLYYYISINNHLLCVCVVCICVCDISLFFFLIEYHYNIIVIIFDIIFVVVAVVVVSRYWQVLVGVDRCWQVVVIIIVVCYLLVIV